MQYFPFIGTFLATDFLDSVGKAREAIEVVMINR